MTTTHGPPSLGPGASEARGSPQARGVARAPGIRRVRGVARAPGGVRTRAVVRAPSGLRVRAVARRPGGPPVRGVAPNPSVAPPPAVDRRPRAASRPGAAGNVPHPSRAAARRRSPTAAGTMRRVCRMAGLSAAVLVGMGAATPVAVPALGPVAERPEAIVTVVGAGGGPGVLGERLPSGQPMAYRSVPGFGFPPGIQAGATMVATDGTVLVAGRDLHGGGGPPTADELVIGAYDPETGSYAQIRVPPMDGPAGGEGAPEAPSVTGLAPLPSRDAVAFTVGPAPDDVRPAWPSLGILAKLDGEWAVTGQWAVAELRGLGELALLPGSGHLIVAQAGAEGDNGALRALRVSGPDRRGQFSVNITGHYPYPTVRDPATGEPLDIALNGLRADPTGEPGQERFVVGLRDRGDVNSSRPLVIQEFRYDAATGAITPASAPTIPGDRRDDQSPLYGYSAALYDRAGNLWAARHDVITGGKLAVYAANAGGGRGVLDRPECPYRPGAEAGEYRTGEVWGQACRPDYDLLQAQELPAVFGLVQGPAGAGIVAVALGGTLLPIRAVGQGEDMTFQIGNLVETGLGLLPSATEGDREHHLGAFDAAGRLWLAGANARPARPDVVADQWLYGVRVGDLFNPLPVRLPDVPGRSVVVRAGYTATTATDQIPGTWAPVEVISRAHVRGCVDWPSTVGCSHDTVAGNGFMLGHPSGFGHPSGEVAYPVEVPVAGRHRVVYRVYTSEMTTEAAITLSVGDASYTTPVSTDGTWRTLPQQESIELPAGVHTIRLAPPEGQGGWFLSWFSLQRA